MAEIGKHRLADAIPHPIPDASSDKEGKPQPTHTSDTNSDTGGKPQPTHTTAAEQIRESQESEKAKNAEESNRDRMVDIGRGNQQAGRQGQ